MKKQKNKKKTKQLHFTINLYVSPDISQFFWAGSLSFQTTGGVGDVGGGGGVILSLDFGGTALGNSGNSPEPSFAVNKSPSFCSTQRGPDTLKCFCNQFCSLPPLSLVIKRNLTLTEYQHNLDFKV